MDWRRAGALLVLITVGVFAIGHSPLRPKPFSDGYFHEEAKGLRNAIRAGSLQQAVPLVHSPGTPFYYLPAYLLLPRGASEQAHWYVGVGWNCVMLWSAALLLGKAAEKLGSDSAARIAGLGVPCAFFPLYYSAGIASETAAFVTAAAVVWAGVRVALDQGGGGAGNTVLLGLAMGALVAMRGNYVLTIPVVVLGGLWSRSRRKQFQLCVAGGLAAVLAAGVFQGVKVMNRAMGGVVRQDAFLTHVLVQGAFQYRNEPFDWRPWERETRDGSADYAAYAEVRRELEERRARTGEPMAALEWAWLRESFLKQPWVWVQMAPMKALSALWFRISPVRVERVLGRGMKASVGAFGISLLLNTPFLLALGLGIVTTLRARREKRCAVLMCWGPLMGGMAFVAATYSEPRYVVPGMGGVVVLAALTIVECVKPTVAVMGPFVGYWGRKRAAPGTVGGPR